MPIQRRLPKTGFTSMSRKLVDEVTLSEVNALPETEITLEILKQHGLVLPCVKRFFNCFWKVNPRYHLEGSSSDESPRYERC